LPKSSVPTPVMLLLLAFSVPPSWKVLICNVPPVADITFVPPPLNARLPLLPVRVNPVVPPKVPLPASVRLPEVERALALEKKLMLPVEALPNWRVCLLLVPRMPLELNDVEPVEPEAEAVGLPPATLVKANFAEVVAVDPSKRSSVVFRSKIVPLLVFSLNGDPPLATGRIPETSVVKLTAEKVGVVPPCST